MCTAVSYQTKSHYFGRNLDLERGYGEGIVITPRNYPFSFRHIKSQENHYAMIGMAAVVNDYPLYFEATNERGVSMAGLNFPEYAFYQDYIDGKENVAPFEFIPYFLGRCSTVNEVRKLLKNINVVDSDFSDELPVTPLHWMVSDKESSITVECTKSGMQVYENSVGMLTNAPTFDKHLENLDKCMELPGDFSSSSRFVKAVFVKENSVCDGSETESVNQFFHILQAVAMPKGCVKTENGEYQYTRYSCCCNTDTQNYYYTTYENMTIQKVEMKEVDLESTKIIYKNPIDSNVTS